MLGTPAYMSPEQLRDPASADVQSDVYSLGVVLFEVLSGELPFAASDRDALLLAIAEHRVRSLRELAPAVSPALGAVIARAMAPDPARRFPDAAAFARALEEARDRPQRFSARWAWVVLAALGSVGAAAAIAGSFSGRGAPPRVEVPAAQRASRLEPSAQDLPRPAVTSRRAQGNFRKSP